MEILWELSIRSVEKNKHCCGELIGYFDIVHNLM